MPEVPPFIDSEMLSCIRTHADWRRLFEVLGLSRDSKRGNENDWWSLSPLGDEKTPSFHINENGWFCHSTHKGGGVIELVQAAMRHRTGTSLNCYEAGRWLLEHDISYLDSSANPSSKARSASGEEKNKSIDAEVRICADTDKRINTPIRQNLIPLFTEQGTHPLFIQRGISRATCEYLGCGFLARSKSPLQERVVFQVRGVQQTQKGYSPCILSHIGRALTPQTKEEHGKWWNYTGFVKTLELYNIDKLLLDENARQQAIDSGHIVLVEGCFDVAKLVEAGILNSVATFGAHLDENQLPGLRLILESLGISKVLVWYDRDQAGGHGQQAALDLLRLAGINASGFDWNRSFHSTKRREIILPQAINDVCDFDTHQLQWLKSAGLT